MIRFFKFAFLGLLPFTAALAEAPDELDEPTLTEAQALALAAETENYWTPERMAGAIPTPIPEMAFDELTLQSSASELDAEAEADELALPGFAPGWKPGQGRQPEAGVEFVVHPDDVFYSRTTDQGALAQPQHGGAPSNPRTGPYGPFQRWTEFDSLTVFPKSTHGKLFYRLNGLNYVCSATVIHRNTLITAGHCNSDGSGTFATNRLFCPSYRNGEHSTRGCWSVINSKTSSRWHNNADPDYDYSCLITQTTGTKIANQIGNVTGWLGRAWNWGAKQPVRTFGYPAASPFNGKRLVTTASSEWYTFQFTSGGQASKLIGSDLTGGASGGSWVLGWHRPGHEFADSDGEGATDPGSNWVNGVNSHKRCRTTCQSPPTDTQGVFWQEMSSPPFKKTSAGDESEDIIAVCFDSGGA